MQIQKRRSIAMNLLFIFIMLLIIAVLSEGGARLLYLFKDELNTVFPKKTPSLDLDGYEMPDPEHPGNWILRPSTKWTLKSLLEEKQKRAAVLGTTYLDQLAREHGIASNDVMFQINRFGFKGPEIDKKHSRARILNIGDSCTFGSWLDKYSYPRSLERNLKAQGYPVEVINAGIEGYSPWNVLFRMDKLKLLEPEFATIYIGWNSIWGEKIGSKSSFYLVRLFKLAWKRLIILTQDPKTLALRQYRKSKHPDRNSEMVKACSNYVPTFLGDLEKIIEELKSIGSQVILITLPGLFTDEFEPTEKALQIGHLPSFTDNPFALAKLTQRYNQSLISLAKQHDVYLIDLDQWSRSALVPRDHYFRDSVHLDVYGQEMIGQYMAEQFEKFFNKKGK